MSGRMDVQVRNNDFVLDKNIFSNVFEKDIRRVYIYKKVERLAKAIHLITPAFRESPTLRNRIDLVTVGLVDAAILPPAAARESLARELLALSSVLAIARTGGLLSDMNTELIGREAHQLLEEIADYHEPRLLLENVPSLAELSKLAASMTGAVERTDTKRAAPAAKKQEAFPKGHIGQIKDTPQKDDRKEAILSVLRTKGPSRIKDLSTVIRGVSEKTIQRELQSMVGSGVLKREGERRWTTYSLV